MNTTIPTAGKIAAGLALAAGAVAATFLTTTAHAEVNVAALATASCDAPGLDDGRSCAGALEWAQNHITSSNAGYYNQCDHVMGLAYGWEHSGSETAMVHWRQIPGQYKHAGDDQPPAGALVFFSTSKPAGHVAMSTGGDGVISTDIGGRGSLTRSTIGQITGKWNAHYLGWANPWFKANH
ncbi:hypothetical protein AB0L06_40765 [Spirillospora sp. NPDC052269]